MRIPRSAALLRQGSISQPSTLPNHHRAPGARQRRRTLRWHAGVGFTARQRPRALRGAGKAREIPRAGDGDPRDELAMSRGFALCPIASLPRPVALRNRGAGTARTLPTQLPDRSGAEGPSHAVAGSFPERTVSPASISETHPSNWRANEHGRASTLIGGLSRRANPRPRAARSRQMEAKTLQGQVGIPLLPGGAR